MSDIKTTIMTYLVQTCLDGDSRGLANDTDLQELGVLDSLTTLDLVAFLEQSFEIQIDPADLAPESFRTIDAIADLVTQKRAAKGT